MYALQTPVMAGDLHIAWPFADPPGNFGLEPSCCTDREFDVPGKGAVLDRRVN